MGEKISVAQALDERDLLVKKIEDKMMSNCFPIEKFSLRYKYFCFVDTTEYLADALFIKHKIRVWFKKEAINQNTDYEKYCEEFKKLYWNK